MNALFYLHSTTPPAPYQGTIPYRDRDGHARVIDAKIFFELTKSIFVTRSFPSARFAPTVPQAEEAVVLISRFIGLPLEEKLRLVHLKPPFEQVGMGVTALKAIRAGEIITPYHGQLIVDEESDSKYCLGDTDAKEFRNLAAMINHSFPNATIAKEEHFGVTEWVIKALDDIAEDDDVCISYGDTYICITLGKHVELRMKAAQEFVQKFSILTDYDEETDIVANTHKWYYLATNMATVLELYFGGFFSWEKLEAFSTNIGIHYKLQRIYHSSYKWLHDALSVLHAPLQATRELDPKLYREIHAYFSHACTFRTALGATYALKMFAAHYNNMPMTRTHWTEIKATIDPYIDAWDRILTTDITSKTPLNKKNPVDRALSVIWRDPEIPHTSN